MTPAERPIIFSAPMVRAILDGRKTMTRRLATSPLAKCRPSDRLWVREALKARSMDLGGALGITEPLTKVDMSRNDLAVSYAADGEEAVNEHGFDYAWLWKRAALPAIHMPRWASRITLDVTAVKIERLQEITEEDALAEGIYRSDPTPEELASGLCDLEDFVFMAPGTRQGWGMTAAERAQEQWGPTAAVAFRFLWNSLHGPEAWDANPEVIAISFRVRSPACAKWEAKDGR
jgi:hypothetical protein